MRYSCGIIFYRSGEILVGHSSGQSHWDLPKGKAEEGETFIEAAIRECKEETDHNVTEKDLTLLGNVQYRKGKRLVLYFSTKTPELGDLKCNSTYVNKRGIVKSEFDEYMYIPVQDCSKYLTKRMCNSIFKAVEEYNNNGV